MKNNTSDIDNLLHGSSGTCTDTLNQHDVDEATNGLDGPSTNSPQLTMRLLLSGGLFFIFAWGFSHKTIMSQNLQSATYSLGAGEQPSPPVLFFLFSLRSSDLHQSLQYHLHCQHCHRDTQLQRLPPQLTHCPQTIQHILQFIAFTLQANNIRILIVFHVSANSIFRSWTVQTHNKETLLFFHHSSTAVVYSSRYLVDKVCHRRCHFNFCYIRNVQHISEIWYSPSNEPAMAHEFPFDSFCSPVWGRKMLHRSGFYKKCKKKKKTKQKNKNKDTLTEY